MCPWLTSATKKLMNERDSFLRKARKTGSEVDWSGGDFHMKQTGMLVLSLWGVNFGFWSR